MVLRVRSRRWLGLQPIALISSLVFHVSVLILTLSLNSLPHDLLPAQTTQRTERKLVVLTLNQELPSIAPPRPAEKIGGAAKKAKKTFRVKSPRPVTNDQLIWNPKMPKILERNVPLPNIVAATMNVPVPTPPPPAPKISKRFEAPRSARKEPKLAPAAVELLDPPPLAVDKPKIAAGNSPGLNGASKLPPAPFSAPQGKTRASPKLEGLGNQPDLIIQAATPGTATDFVSKQNIDLAALAPAPSDRAAATIPEGSRTASVNQGQVMPTPGDPSPAPGAARIPGLDATTEGTPSAAAGRTGVDGAASAALAAQFSATSVSTPRSQIDMKRGLFSVAFNEKGGVVIQAVRDKFTPRRFYLAIIERPNPTHFPRDWYLWFAETNPLPGDSPQINPPVLVRLIDPIGPKSALRKPYVGTVLVAAVIRTSGFVDKVSIIKGVDDALDDAVRQALLRTTFLPALRSGIKTEIDVLLEIPVAAKP